MLLCYIVNRQLVSSKDLKKQKLQRKKKKKKKKKKKRLPVPHWPVINSGTLYPS